jgi:hypothetical protein
LLLTQYSGTNEDGYSTGLLFSREGTILAVAATPDIQAIADRVAVAYGPYRQAIDRMFDPADRGDTTLVLKIDDEEVDPRFDAIEGLVNKAAGTHHAAGLTDLAELKQREAFNARATP